MGVSPPLAEKNRLATAVFLIADTLTIPQASWRESQETSAPQRGSMGVTRQMPFDIRQLRYAIAGANHGSFYRAARTLDIE